MVTTVFVIKLHEINIARCSFHCEPLRYPPLPSCPPPPPPLPPPPPPPHPPSRARDPRAPRPQAETVSPVRGVRPGRHSRLGRTHADYWAPSLIYKVWCIHWNALKLACRDAGMWFRSPKRRITPSFGCTPARSGPTRQFPSVLFYAIAYGRSSDLRRLGWKTSPNSLVTTSVRNRGACLVVGLRTWSRVLGTHSSPSTRK